MSTEVAIVFFVALILIAIVDRFTGSKCSICDGIGTIEFGHKCPVCRGKGKV